MAEQMTPQTQQDVRPDEELSLEEAFSQIEEVLGRMEKPDLPLRESLSLYERGVRLLRQCNEQIDRVEKQMITLRAGSDDEENMI